MKQYLRFKGVQQRYGGAGRSTIYEWVKAGILPQPHKIGGTRVFDVDELDEHDERRKNAEAE